MASEITSARYCLWIKVLGLVLVGIGSTYFSVHADWDSMFTSERTPLGDSSTLANIRRTTTALNVANQRAQRAEAALAAAESDLDAKAKALVARAEAPLVGGAGRGGSRATNTPNQCPGLESEAFPLHNKPGYSVLQTPAEVSGDGVIAASCRASGWNYVFSYPRFDRRGLGWSNAASKVVMGKPQQGMLCGYDWSDALHNLNPKGACGLIVDVGGNMGLSVMPAVSRGWRVVTFEPIPNNVEQLRLNLFLNGFEADRVALVAAAASSKAGSVDIFVPRGREDNSAIANAKTAGRNVGGEVDAITISTVTLDAYFDGASPDLRGTLRMVKIDTQGHELDVVRGMQRLLTSVPYFTVVVELDHELQKSAGHDPMEVVTHMEGLGYEPLCLENDRLVPQPPGKHPACYDVVFQHRPVAAPSGRDLHV